VWRLFIDQLIPLLVYNKVGPVASLPNLNLFAMMPSGITETPRGADSAGGLLESIEEEFAHHVEQRLDLRETKLYGRSNEVEILRSSYRRVCRGKSELVLVKGISGSGKSKLVEEGLRCYVTEEQGGFYVIGKYDSLRNEPFSAIVGALNDLTELILESDAREGVQKKLDSTFTANEIAELIGLVPGLARLCGQPSSDPRQGTTLYMVQACLRFRILCRSLVTALATPAFPVAIILEDIQWIDGDSVEMLKTVVADASSENLLLVCTTRETAGMPFQRESSMPTSDILVGDISAKHVASLISDMFHIQETKSLSEVVLKKTSGNMLHISQFLDLLQLDGFLVPADGGWSYDLDEIDESAVTSDTAAELVQIKIQRLEQSVHDVLKIASCLGHRFKRDLLVHVCRSLSDEAWGDTKRRVKKVLETAVHLGYLESSKGQYGFVHDRIHQCWYRMAREAQDPKAMHLEIGRVVRLQMLIDQDNSLLFLAADNICRGLKCLDAGSDIPQTLEMLLEASKVAIAKFAFVQASMYTHAALYLLRTQPRSWKQYHHLSVKIILTKVEVEKSMGRFENSRRLAGEVLENSNSFEDSSKAYFLILESMGCEGKLTKAMEYGYKILRSLGEKLPSSNILYHLVREIGATRKVLRKMSDGDFLCLPIMQDTHKLTAMKILSKMMTFSYLTIKDAADGQRFCLLGLRMMQLTVKYGLCHTSCAAFGSHGVFQAIMGNVSEAVRFGNLATQLVHQLEAKESEPETDSVIQCHVMHYQRHWLQSREALQRAYPKALYFGRVSTAFQIASGLIVTAGMSESPLSLVDKEIGGYCTLMKEYGQDAFYKMGISSWQRAKNYMGEAEDVVILTGAAMREEDVEAELKQDKNVVGLQALYLQKMELAFFLEAWDTVAALIATAEKGLKALETHISQYPASFLVAASYFALYRLTRQRKYRRGAVRVTKKIKKWAGSGMKDCESMVCFLEAEMYLTNGEHIAPGKYFEASRKLSSSKWLPHYQALAHERAGSFYLLQGDRRSAAEQYSVALTKYEIWEGFAVLRRLKRSLENMPSQTDVESPVLRKFEAHLTNESTSPSSTHLGLDSSSTNCSPFESRNFDSRKLLNCAPDDSEVSAASTIVSKV
jgi:predicted ATPase